MLEIKTAKIKKVVLLVFFVLLLSLILLISFLFLKSPKQEEPLIEDKKAEVVYPFPDKPNEHHPITEERCNLQESESAKEACFEELKYTNAILNRNIEICKELIDKNRVDECIFKIARSVMDEKLCGNIENEHEKGRCTKEIAVDRLDSDICDYFLDEPFERRECKDKVKAFDIILNNKDIKLCDDVRTLEYGPLCFKYMIHKIDYDCDQLSGQQKDLCVSIVIKHSAKSVEECQTIPLENYRKVCLNKIATGKSDFDIDSDNDGKSDGGELFYNLDPFNPDTDGDGIKDGVELLEYHSDPSSVDTDRDGLNDYEEIFTYKTNVNNPDTDDDGYQDGEEVKSGYNPLGSGRLER